MNLLVYVVGFCILAVVAYSFRATFRKTWRKLSPPPRQWPIPEIPPELPAKPEPSKIFFDPLLMQVHGDQTEMVTFVSPTGQAEEVLVNKSAADIFNAQGWTPFRYAVEQWADSPAYCRCGPLVDGEDDSLSEMSLAYLYAELLGDAQFDQAFQKLEKTWRPKN